ncbi:MAG: hypothetical protein DRQ39_10060 [Gammaproteobacteria bacterium]|nr:MAG: hypothetical protein DRQ39_10060 [Gammaproteobacteria bacterium]
MHASSKVESYRKKLIELRELRLSGTPDPAEEKSVLEIMEVLWESMSVEDRDYFRDTNHLSWPPPRNTGEE